jgi:RNA polymerase sigma factor (sigma-70 family)
MIENDSTLAFEEHREFLTKLASRIAGNWSDAEDLVNQAFVRWQNVDFRTVTNPRAFLATTVSRLALNHKASSRVRREVVMEPEVVNRLRETSGENFSSFTDALTNAFEIVLSRLSPVERAVFLLREVFQFEYAEVSEFVGETEANCRQILKRARDKISLREARFPVRSDVCELAIERFLNASRNGTIDELMDTVAPEVLLIRDPGDIGLPNPPSLSGKRALLDHVQSYFQRRPTVRWSCCQIGEGYQIAFLSDALERPVSALICQVDDQSIKRVDHITCPSRLGILLSVVGGGGAKRED